MKLGNTEVELITLRKEDKAAYTNLPSPEFLNKNLSMLEMKLFIDDYDVIQGWLRIRNESTPEEIALNDFVMLFESP
jgi:hypothetical protein